MENVLYVERRKLSKITQNNTIEDLNLQQKLNININEIATCNESTSRTASSQNYSSSNFQFLNEKKINNQKQKIQSLKGEIKRKRRDNFGNEIKKGGKQKIAFVDDIKMMHFTQYDNIKNNSKKRRKEKYSPSLNFQKKELPKIETIGRSHTFISSYSFKMKNIYNIAKMKLNEKKSLEGHLVDVIKVESTKKENKINTYFVKNRNNNGEEQDVFCSCYCSII